MNPAIRVQISVEPVLLHLEPLHGTHQDVNDAMGRRSLFRQYVMSYLLLFRTLDTLNDSARARTGDLVRVRHT